MHAALPQTMPPPPPHTTPPPTQAPTQVPQVPHAFYYRVLALGQDGGFSRCPHEHPTIGEALACRNRIGEGAYIQAVGQDGERGLDFTEMAEVMFCRAAARAQRFQQFHRDEVAQDLIEYSLVAALIAFAAVSGMNFVAQTINNAFSNIGNKLSNAIS